MTVMPLPTCKIAASLQFSRHLKLRSGRRPIGVEKLLNKEKASTIQKLSEDVTPFFTAVKTAAFGDTEPLWMDNNVGRVDYESKIPIKTQTGPRRFGSSSEVPTVGVGGGVRMEDGRSNATTINQGTVANGEVVPDAFPSGYKFSSAIQKLAQTKWAEVSDAEAMDTLQRLDAMDRNKLTPGQVGRYVGIGAIAGPAISATRSLIQKRPYFKDADTLGKKLRVVAGDAFSGGVASGVIPVIRSSLDRRAALGTLEDYMEKQPSEAPKVAGVLSHLKAPLHSSEMEHLTDLGGLGLMAAGSASHLYGQLKNKEESPGPIPAAGQSALDLTGLGAMAIPTVAALARGKQPGSMAGGGRKFTNAANLVGLGALAIPTADKLQAHLRGGEDKELLSHGAHKALELGGYGALMAGTLTNPDNELKDKIMQGVGYGALALPQVAPVEGSGRTALELGGLGMLAAPSLLSMRGHH